MPTNEELQLQIQKLGTELEQFKGIYYKTNFIDKSVFENPVYFKKIFIPIITATPTSTPEKGCTYYNVTDDKLYIFNGTAFKSVALT